MKSSIAGFFLGISTLFCFGLQPATGDVTFVDRGVLTKVLASSPLSEEQQIVHALNRLAYGPRPGDVQKVKAMGLAAYIDQQLHPETLDDSALEPRLAGLETIGKSSRELAELYPKPQAKAMKGQTKRPEDSLSDMKQDPSSDPQRTKEEQAKAARGVRRVVLELQQAKVLRATYSERQLQEVMTDFWFNHFNVFIGKGADRILTTEYEREAIRPNALGNFKDLLEATSKSPAMLFYLDNWMSSDPDAKPPDPRVRRRFALNGDTTPPINGAKGKRFRGLNENYARELMELHTLGVDGGYSQKDVTEVARCFTGWTLRNPKAGGGFQFVSFLHDKGEKSVLGKSIPAGGGLKDGLLVLDFLARHPSTARFVSTKLCRRFVSDNPPETLVAKCTDAFLKSNGEIRQVLVTIFASPEFYSKDAYRVKTKKPFELVVSSLRATGAETMAPPMMLGALRSMGEMLYGCQPPTGYADTSDAWINTGALLERMNFATALATGRIPRTKTGIDSRMSLTGDTKQLVQGLAKSLLNEEPRKEFVLAMQKKLEGMAAESPGEGRQRVSRIAGLILGSPEFQKR